MFCSGLNDGMIVGFAVAHPSHLRLDALQRLQNGFFSSHLSFRSLQVVQPVLTFNFGRICIPALLQYLASN